MSLVLMENNVTGGLPDSFGDLGTLQIFGLGCQGLISTGSGTGISGTLPATITSMSALRLFLSYQAAFLVEPQQRGTSGTIPPMPASVQELLFATSGRMSGTLPELQPESNFTSFLGFFYDEFPQYLNTTS